MMPQEDLSKRYGRFMWGVAWLLFLGMATYFINIWYDSTVNPNRDLRTKHYGETKEVILTRNRYHAYVTPGYINNQPVTFVVDTGATTVALSDEVARRIGITAGAAVRIGTAGGTVTGYLATLDKVAVGPIVFHHVKATITPTLHDDTVLLGMSALRDITFIQRGDELILRQAPVY